MDICICLLLILLLCYVLSAKSHYKRFPRRNSGIGCAWRRAGGAGRNLALKGTRHPKLPHPDDNYYIIT